jgi:hypothetical protein
MSLLQYQPVKPFTTRDIFESYIRLCSRMTIILCVMFSLILIGSLISYGSITGSSLHLFSTISSASIGIVWGLYFLPLTLFLIHHKHGLRNVPLTISEWFSDVVHISRNRKNAHDTAPCLYIAEDIRKRKSKPNTLDDSNNEHDLSAVDDIKKQHIQDKFEDEMMQEIRDLKKKLNKSEEPQSDNEE